mmetsp:Transcript_4616/g.18792  ORF Transcript_4616/g.18792 Transcript_4616/m.18792 type:complete len:253 (+) Transcript_4616:1585-2343(+)
MAREGSPCDDDDDTQERSIHRGSIQQPRRPEEARRNRVENRPRGPRAACLFRRGRRRRVVGSTHVVVVVVVVDEQELDAARRWVAFRGVRQGRRVDASARRVGIPQRRRAARVGRLGHVERDVDRGVAVLLRGRPVFVLGRQRRLVDRRRGGFLEHQRQLDVERRLRARVDAARGPVRRRRRRRLRTLAADRSRLVRRVDDRRAARRHLDSSAGTARLVVDVTRRRGVVVVDRGTTRRGPRRRFVGSVGRRR